MHNSATVHRMRMQSSALDSSRSQLCNDTSTGVVRHQITKRRLQKVVSYDVLHHSSRGRDTSGKSWSHCSWSGFAHGPRHETAIKRAEPDPNRSHSRAAYITKNAPYAWGNFHTCAITKFQKPQHLGRVSGRVRVACSSIATSRALRAESDLSHQRCCKLRLKLLLVPVVVDQLAKKTWKLIVEFVTTKRLVCKNGHSLVEPPFRMFYTVSVSACLFVGERFFQKVYWRPLPSSSPFTLFTR